ncbi:TadE family protein [Rhodoferax ferrireducens]|uniref:TadE family protein n=1 Tax=Rhodoferax ferrireducens TaxID=192843 RepID=UPI0018E5A0AA|nr:TadE family protein [Rhodoferax ferrireducens]
MNKIRHSSRQRGVATVEFAIVSSLLFTILFGVMEMGRLLWTWNAATEATRLGARLAVVCDVNRSMNAPIKSRMHEMLPALTNANITISYLNPPNTVDPSCTNATCKAARVSLSGFTHTTVIPFVPLSLTLPPFSTTLRKEFMSSTANEVCP